MRDENKALWREVSRLGGRVPSHVANTLSQSTSSSSTTGPKLHIGGEDEDEDGSDEGFSFNVMGPGMGIGMGMGGGSEAWMNWAGAEMRRERRKVEKLTGIVRALCDAIGSGTFPCPHFNTLLILRSIANVSPRTQRSKRTESLPFPSPSKPDP
jgi:hypothetical protein